MSETTSPSSVRLHPLSSSSSMSSTDSAPPSEPTSDEQPDLGAFTTVLRAWTYLQPPPRIPIQIYSPTTSTTTTFQPDQSVVESDFQSSSQAPPPSSPSSFTRPPSGSVLREDSTLPPSFSSFTRPTSSSVLREESTVWNHAPIASYLYSETPSIELEDENSVVSTEGGRTVEINSELSFEEHLSLVPSQPPSDVAVPVILEPPILLPESDSSALTSRLRTNLLPSSDTVSYSSDLSLLSYQIPDSEDSDQNLPVAQRTTISTASLKSQRSSTVSNPMTTPTFGPHLAITALPVHEQHEQQHRTVLIHPPPQTISDDASVSHLSLPPTDPPLPSVSHSNSKSHSSLSQKQPSLTSLPQPQPKLGIETSISSLTRGIDADRQGTIVIDDLRTPDHTHDSSSVDWKRNGKAGGFKPVDDDREEERDRKTRAYELGFGFGRVPQGWGHSQKYVSGYTSNYEGSQSSFRSRKSLEMRGRSTRLEPQHEDNEDSSFNSDVAEHPDDEDQNEAEEEEEDHYPFPRYRRRSGEFHFQTHTPRYYGGKHTPPRGVLPNQAPQIRTQSSMELLRDLDYPHASQPQSQPQSDSRQQFYSRYSELDSYPDPYPRPHARPHVQDRDRDISSRSSHSPLSSLPSISPSPSRSQMEPSPIQRDYVLIQPQTQLSVPVSFLQSTQTQTQTQTRSHLQQSQSQPQSQKQTQSQTSHSVSYLSTQNPGLSIYSSMTTTMTMTAFPPIPASIVPAIPPSSSLAVASIPPSSTAVSVPASLSYSNLRQGQEAVTNGNHHDSLPLLSSDSHALPPPPPASFSASPSVLLSAEKVLKPDSTSGEVDNMKRASWEYVDMEEDELIPVSERSSNGVGVVSGGGGDDSGLGVGSGTAKGFGHGHPSPKAQNPLSMTQQQPLTKTASINQQQRRQLELEHQQSDLQVRLHVELDSDGSDGEGGKTTAGPSVLISNLNATTTAPSTTVSTAMNTDNTQPQNLNPILPPIPLSIPKSSSTTDPEPNTDAVLNPKFDLRTNNPSNHIHSHSSNPGSHYHHSQVIYPEFPVAHVEDTTESELEMDLDHDRDIESSAVGTTVQRVGGGDVSLPSLGYLDEALSFIAQERARWTAAREGGGVGAGGSGSGEGVGSMGADAGFAKEGEKTENWKVLDHDVDIPKRKRRRKRRQQSQPPQQALSNFAQPLHTADEDGGGPSTTSSTKKKKARSSSWSPAKKKNGKGKEKEFLIAPHPTAQLSTASAHPSLLATAVLIEGERGRSDGGGGSVVSSSKSVDLLSANSFSKKAEDRGRTLTNGSGVAEDVFGPVVTGPMNLSKKRGKKMGKKERERERVRKDLMIGRSIGNETVVQKVPSRGREVTYEEDDDNEGDNDENDEEEDDVVSHDDLSIEDNSSLNNLSLLQPPQSRHGLGRRRKGKDTAYIHSRAGIAGAYKSTPGSPKRRGEFDDILVDREGEGGHGHGSLGDVEAEDNAGGGGGAPDVVPDKSVGKKRTLSKRRKGLVRVRSVPQLDAEEPTLYAPEETIIPPGKSKSKKSKSKAVAAGGVDLPDMDQPQTKRSRLIALAKELRQFFPEQRQELRRVTARFEKQSMEPRGKAKKLIGDAVGVGGPSLLPATSGLLPVPGVRKPKWSMHRRSGSETTIADIHDDSIEGGEAAGRDTMPDAEEEDEEELDPRGRPPRKGDVLIHVFIDHSNILIGLLSHLKRLPLSHATAQPKGIMKRGHPLPTISAKTTPTVSMSHVTTSALAFAAVKPTSTRPLPNPNSTISADGKSNANTSSSSSIPIAVPGDYHHPIPLPSFATMSRSLPSGSVLNEYLVENDDGSQIEEQNAHSDTYEYHQSEDEDLDVLGQIASLVKAKPNQKEKKPLKHLWHAALVLLLERGRSVTRRVAVTSSPLYQPMDELERLGYELRVYVRVPDLGDGMDRDRRRDTSTSLSGGSKSVQSSPANPVSFSGLPLSVKKKKAQILGHVRRISGSTSAESGSGRGDASGNASGGASNPHPYHGIANNTPPLGKIKYREQGVDELLQLKLHQALAATDNVPEGSTIVLATGDGNMGQFNEDGFLGPIRTALRRGWKVELYAWEDGLSRAWRREFGESTEWGRKGMFSVIGMEQFAASLVEVIDL